MVEIIHDYLELQDVIIQLGADVVWAAACGAVRSYLVAEPDAIREAALAVLDQEGAALSQDEYPVEAVERAMGPVRACGLNTPLWLRDALAALSGAPTQLVGPELTTHLTT
jgi:hypothetical protein